MVVTFSLRLGISLPRHGGPLNGTPKDDAGQQDEVLGAASDLIRPTVRIL